MGLEVGSGGTVCAGVGDDVAPDDGDETAL